jgi:hypothetical protein
LLWGGLVLRDPRLAALLPLESTVQASSTTPSGRMTGSGKPSCTVVSTTTAGVNSFMTASTSRKSAGTPLMTRPTQRFVFDMAAHPAPSA